MLPEWQLSKSLCYIYIYFKGKREWQKLRCWESQLGAFSGPNEEQWGPEVDQWQCCWRVGGKVKSPFWNGSVNRMLETLWIWGWGMSWKMTCRYHSGCGWWCCEPVWRAQEEWEVKSWMPAYWGGWSKGVVRGNNEFSLRIHSSSLFLPMRKRRLGMVKWLIWGHRVSWLIENPLVVFMLSRRYTAWLYPLRASG